MITIQTERLLTTAAAARAIGVSTRRVLYLVAEGKLSPVKVEDTHNSQHIFTLEDVERFARSRKSAGGQ